MKIHRNSIVAGGILGIVAGALVAMPTLERVDACIRSEVWPRPLLLLTIGADLAFAVAYAWIPVTLYAIWRKRRDVPASWTLVCFAAFIVLCGITHALDIVTAFRPVYWLSAQVKVAGAVVSLATAALLQTRVGPLLLTLQSYGEVVGQATAAKQESSDLRQALADVEAARALAQAEAARALRLAEELRTARAAAEDGERRALAENDALRTAHEEIHRQRAAIRELSTPILRVDASTVVLPIIGMVDSVRAADMTDALLATIQSTGARSAIVDITGVGTMDTKTIQYIAQMIQAAKLMGSRAVITGMRADVARTLVAASIDMQGIETRHSLEQGLKWAARSSREDGSA